LKIAVISDEHYPCGQADTEVVVNTAAALGTAGAEVSLLVPFLWRRKVEDVLSFYGVPKSFRLVSIPGWLLPERTLRVEKLFHGVLAPLWSALGKVDVLHSRDGLSIATGHLLGARWSFETYRRLAEETPWLKKVMKRVDLTRGIGAVAHAYMSRNDLIQLGFEPDHVIVARPGAALDRYTPMLDQDEARQRCGLPSDAPIVGYVGNVQLFKGMGEVLDVAEQVPEARFLIVGGSPKEVEILKHEAGRRGIVNLILAGHLPAGDVAQWLFAADLLLQPATYRNENPSVIGRRLFSPRLPGTPFKLFSHFAAGKPTVAADQEINTELLREGETALMVPPGDAASYGAAIRKLLGDPALCRRMGKTARAEAEKRSWVHRAELMLGFFERRLAEISRADR
jgi:glycosyltransferase involved in cell wall biosynthesis